MTLDTLNVLSRYQVEIPDGEEGGAEISAYDPLSQSLFVVNAFANAIDILNIADPTNPFLVSSIDISSVGAAVNSVAVNDGIVAVAVANDPEQEPGTVAFFDTEGTFLRQVTVGALPDMLTFTPDGTKVLVANEGETGDEIDSETQLDINFQITDLSKGQLAEANIAGFDSSRKPNKSDK